MDAMEMERMEALRAVLCKYGLEVDFSALWAMGVREGDVAWLVMTAEEMLENGLTGSAEQYVAMQQGEYVSEPADEGETNWYRYGE
jgi:hypothetical protein